MTTEIAVPALPQSNDPVKIARIHVTPGQQVHIDDILFEVETDKVVLEVPASAHGIIEKIDVVEQQQVISQQVVMILNESPQLEPTAAFEPSFISATRARQTNIEEPTSQHIVAARPETQHSSKIDSAIFYGLVGLVLGIFITVLMMD